ncbi:hypothetical protein NUU61_008048 [Penicillium alfredii]|uniref:Tyrosine specific protein phosphatases domain-containing protein n=1 Tax=Penicillium alfredii TaxID=1506179 RepID=A0A9W9ERX3_9EURO|nr:uncharacterized protein NUU61_008048 [Penicillium alfredii]KAJ5086741.1 hypothetical protein NUU61_008048 [Penicillium alfredii]
MAPYSNLFLVLGPLLVSIFLLSCQAQAAAIQARAKEPKFLTKSTADLEKKYKDLKHGPKLKNGPSFVKTNDILWFDNHFARWDQLFKHYPYDDDRDYLPPEENPFGGIHPRLKAAPLPGFDAKTNPFSYIASESPIKGGKGQKTLYWDMIWANSKEEIVAVSLLESDSDYTQEQVDSLIPSRKGNPISFYAIDNDKGYETCNVKYTVDYEDGRDYINGDLQYRRVRLRRGDQSRIIHFYHYTEWIFSTSISTEELQQLIDIVNERSKSVPDTPIVVNCLYGLGRTGTFIEAREISNGAQEAKDNGKNWFSKYASGRTDPIVDYTNRLRQIRDDMIDSSKQFVFLHQPWADAIYKKLYG